MNTATKERPIIFSAPMVRAILDGRKTQTRRPVKPEHYVLGARTVRWENATRETLAVAYRCPYGAPGDRLWVRETLDRGANDQWFYAVDNAPVTPRDPTAAVAWAHHMESAWCSPIFMPRWASRITLEVVAVRVERLQAISEADAKAEGVDADSLAGSAEYRPCFEIGWNYLYGKRPEFLWHANPWVWVVEFKRTVPA